MARKYRYFVPFGYYHVYVRVARGEMIFDDPLLSEHWIQTAKKVAADFELRILAWCLMTNHFHLVLQCGTIPLWAAMARLQVTTSNKPKFATFLFSGTWLKSGGCGTMSESSPGGKWLRTIIKSSRKKTPLMTLRLSMVHLFLRSTREPASESSLNGSSKHATFRLGSWRVTFEQPS